MILQESFLGSVPEDTLHVHVWTCGLKSRVGTSFFIVSLRFHSVSRTVELVSILKARSHMAHTFGLVNLQLLACARVR